MKKFCVCFRDGIIYRNQQPSANEIRHYDLVGMTHPSAALHRRARGLEVYSTPITFEQHQQITQRYNGIHTYYTHVLTPQERLSIQGSQTHNTASYSRTASATTTQRSSSNKRKNEYNRGNPIDLLSDNSSNNSVASSSSGSVASTWSKHVRKKVKNGANPKDYEPQHEPQVVAASGGRNGVPEIVVIANSNGTGVNPTPQERTAIASWKEKQRQRQENAQNQRSGYHH